MTCACPLTGEGEGRILLESLGGRAPTCHPEGSWKSHPEVRPEGQVEEPRLLRIGVWS